MESTATPSGTPSTAGARLGEHVERSVRRGDPVVVHGRLSAQTWTNTAGIEVTSYEVDAVFVGHDLNRGTSAFTKTPRPALRPSRVGRRRRWWPASPRPEPRVRRTGAPTNAVDGRGPPVPRRAACGETE